MLPTDLEYRTLQSCYDDIRQQLHYHSVGPKLLSKGVITFEAHEEIKSEKVSFMQNEAFLKFLMNGSRDGFYAFQNILVNTAGMTHLYDSLQEAMKEIQQEPRVIPPKVSQEVASPIPEEDVSSNDSIVVGGTLVQRRKGSSIQNSDPSEGETVTNESIANVLLNVFNQMIEQVRNHPLITLAVVVIVVVCTFAYIVQLYPSRSQFSRSHSVGAQYNPVPESDYEPSGPATLDSRPTMKQLRKHVIPHAASLWQGLAEMLLEPPNLVSQIERDHNRVVDRCANVFTKWLELTPDATWSSLLHVLDQLGHKSLSSRLKSDISSRQLD